MAMGASAGAISGALTDVGIDDGFLKSLATTIKPDGAALCVLIRTMTADKVLEEVKQFGGEVIQSNLSHESEEKLRVALASVQPDAAGTTAAV
jgi:uncharacterized membrane protein